MEGYRRGKNKRGIYRGRIRKGGSKEINEGLKIWKSQLTSRRIFRALWKAGVYESPKSETLGEPVWRILSAEPVFQSSLSGEGETFSRVKNGMEILENVKNLLKNNKKLDIFGFWERIVEYGKLLGIFPGPNFHYFQIFWKKFFRKKFWKASI